MTNPHAHRIKELAADSIALAGVYHYEWDRRAVDWPLTQRSVVVEVGGYTGRWALQIAQRYHCRLYVFEPQPWACAVCREVLGPLATVGCFGLGATDDILPMGGWETDGCSFLKPGEGTGRLREISAAFADLGIRRIDLMLVNIEGYEYTLLPHMLAKGIYPKRLMIQFHPFTTDDERAQAAIIQQLAAKAYTQAWDYGDVLSAWERKK